MIRNFLASQCVRSVTEPELGLGHIVAVEAQVLLVTFPKSSEKRIYSKKTAPLEHVVLSAGSQITTRAKESIVIEKIHKIEGLYAYESKTGVLVPEKDIVDVKQSANPLEALRDGRISSFDAFELRKKAQSVLHSYKNSRLHGFVGSRVVLSPHQLYAVDKIVSMPYPRALLADEVGLGKTIEAALIFSKLKALGRAAKVLVLVPEALKHQWLSELYRKFLERFTLVDESRWIEEIKSQESNSFASNAYVLASLDLFYKEKNAFAAALNEKWDLVIVDEAHQLTLLEKEAPNTLKFFIDLSEKSKSMLFLTATPHRFGQLNFEKLLNLLKTKHDYPLEYIHNRREIIKGFPQRVLKSYEIKAKDKWKWLSEFVKDEEREKILLIVSSEEEAQSVFKFLSEKTGVKMAVFSESMDLLQRDKQAAWFAEPDGARMLVCSEMGSEGRNFQFCHDLILFDIPQNPDILEQRIGRLDRIGQKEDVCLHVPYLEESADEFYLELFDEVFGIFHKPCPFASQVYDRLSADLSKKTLLSNPAKWIAFRTKAKKIFDEEEKNYIETIQKDVDAKSFDAVKAKVLLDEILQFDKTKKTDDLFESFMEHFGIVHDDFGLERTLKLGGETLSFVQDFPHLAAFEEKTVTFSRNIALIREDIEFLTLEHPLFLACFDYFFGKESAIAGMSFSRQVSSRKFIMECSFLGMPDSVFVRDTGEVFLPPQQMTVQKDKKIAPQDAQQMYTLYGAQLNKMLQAAMAWAAKSTPNSGAPRLDSLHVFIG